MFDRVQLPHALDLYARGSCTTDLCPHLVKEVCEIDDLGLASRVLYHGRAHYMDGGHHEVLGGTDACKVEHNLGALEAMRYAGVDVSVIDIEVDAEGLQAQDMHVYLARPDVTAARHCDDCLAEARQQRSEHGRRCPHLGDEVVGRLPPVDRGRVDLKLMLAKDLYPRAQILEHLAHNMHICNVGNICKRIHAGRHERCRHELERRVLGTLDCNLTLYGTSTLDPDDFQLAS